MVFQVVKLNCSLNNLKTYILTKVHFNITKLTENKNLSDNYTTNDIHEQGMITECILNINL